MQDAKIIESAYTDLEAGLDAFVEAVSDLLSAERLGEACESGTPGGLASLARAKWSRLRALNGESLLAWIGAEVERAHVGFTFTSPRRLSRCETPPSRFTLLSTFAVTVDKWYSRVAYTLKRSGDTSGRRTGVRPTFRSRRSMHSRNRGGR